MEGNPTCRVQVMSLKTMLPNNKEIKRNLRLKETKRSYLCLINLSANRNNSGNPD